jgi:hypothetical protein
MQEEFKYFISYASDLGGIILFRNKEIVSKLIESEEDIRTIEKGLTELNQETAIIINYRMF